MIYTHAIYLTSCDVCLHCLHA